MRRPGLLALLLAPAAVLAQPTLPPPESGIVAVPGFPTAGLPGQAAGDGYGWSVAGAGDVNGDGYDDMIVGGPLNDAGGTSAGRAYVYFGGPGADALPDLILTGEVANDQFGFAVAGIGDVNGDGYDDVAVGAPLYDDVAASTGAVYVFFGGGTPNAVADIKRTGGQANENLGWSVAGAGDVNADGTPDWLVGARLYDDVFTDAGRVYLYSGTSIAPEWYDGVAASDQFGSSVAGAGDVNGDGFDDVIVGAPRHDGGALDGGGAFVFFGGAAFDGTPDLVATGPTVSDLLGASVAGAGDVNGDGFDDLLVGVPLQDGGGSAAGQARVYLGGAAPDAVADAFLFGSAAGDEFGASVSGAGDVNNDGFDDVIVGARNNDAGATNAGRATVHFGGPAGPGSAPDLVLTGTGSNDRFGIAVAGVGDLDGDGLPDLAIGADGDDPPTGTNAGSVLVVSNATAGHGIAIWRAVGAAASDQFGSSVASAGDVNGDGYDDLIAGAPTNDAAGVDAGRAYIYFGGPAPNTVADVILTGVVTGDQFGYAVAGAGDVNGDGFDDVIVGAPAHDAGGTNAGRAYLFLGGASMNTVADVLVTGLGANALLGYAVAGAGDVNGDGYADWIVGGSGDSFGGPSAGHASLYLGAPVPTNTFALSLFGAAGDQFGYDVGGAGDVNGDGYHDFLVGAPFNDGGGSNAGLATLYFGAATLDPTPDRLYSGTVAGQTLGRFVEGVGDVDGDGYDDVAVSGSSSGTAPGVRLYLGGLAPVTTPFRVFVGETSNDAFGALGRTGDVNGDGYDDLLIGASSNGSGNGRAYLYLGGAAPDTTPATVFTGSAGDFLGAAVSGTGDFNADGRLDLAVGAAGAASATGAVNL